MFSYQSPVYTYTIIDMGYEFAPFKGIITFYFFFRCGYMFYYFNGRDLSWKNWFHSFFRLPDKFYFRKSSAFCGFSIASSFILVSLFAIVHNLLNHHILIENYHLFLIFLNFQISLIHLEGYFDNLRH